MLHLKKKKNLTTDHDDHGIRMAEMLTCTELYSIFFLDYPCIRQFT